jgi:hypothetical protein
MKLLSTAPLEFGMNQPQKQNWWRRNWKWVVPVGCFSCLVLMLGFVALIMSFVFGIMKSSDAYKQALVMAESNPAVVSALGKPIHDGFFTYGNINVSGSSGNADLEIPISGPKGKGRVYVEAKKSTGEWSFSKLIVQIDQSNERINLLNEKK